MSILLQASVLSENGKMKYTHIAFTFLSCLVILAAATPPRPAGSPDPPGPDPVQITIPGFPYNGNISTIDHPNDPVFLKKMRANRWDLFRALVVNGKKWPTWETWYTKCDLDLSVDCDDVASKHQAFTGESPQLIDQHKKPIKREFSTVYYSPIAAKYIQQNQLNSGPALQQIILKELSNNHNAPSISGFPDGSIVVKEIWEAFNYGRGLSNLETVHLYNGDPAVAASYRFDDSQLKAITDWTANTIQNHSGTVDMDTECGNSYTVGSTLPVKCFYWRKFPGLCKPVDQRVPAPQGASPVMGDSCFVVMVGVHIITKENGNWRWATYWWTTDPSKVPAKNDANPRLPPMYSHYVMDVDFGSTAQPMFSPYLEGPRPKGTQSRCIGCHRKAFYDPSCVAGQCGSTDPKHATGMGLNGAGNEVNSNRDEIAPNPCKIKTLGPGKSCRLATDFLFSIDTAQDPENIQPRMMLQ